MKNVKTIALMTMLTACSSAFAQYSPEGEYGFVGIQAGGHITTAENSSSSPVMPKVGVQLGSWFNPNFGLRMSFQGWENKIKFDNEAKYNGLTGDLDAMLSLSNIFYPNRTSDRWNTFFVAGVGANAIWDKPGKVSNGDVNYNCLSENLNSYWVNNRLGLGVEYNISEALGLNLEVDCNWKNKNMAFLADGKSIMDVTAMIGLNVRFGENVKKRIKDTPTAAPVTSEADYEAELAARAAAEAKAAEAAKAKAIEAKRIAEAEATAKAAKVKAEAEAKAAKLAAPLADVNLQYDRCGVDVSASDSKVLAEVAEWAKANSGKRIVVNGYADRGTGNPTINMKYSRMRANNVADALKNAGVPADQIVVKAWGDKVQPYKENDRNRCVIVVEK